MTDPARPARRATLSALLAAALAVPLALTIAAAAPEPAAADSGSWRLPCPTGKETGYLFVYVRGSQSGGTTKKANDFKPRNSYSTTGYSKSVPPFVKKTTEGIRDGLTARAKKAGKTARFMYVYLDYPAYLGTTSPKTPSELKASFATYQASVKAGGRSMADVARFHNQCPSLSVVAIGYSQGSEVIQRFMVDPKNDSIAPRLVKAVLIGNPLYTKSPKGIATNPGLKATSGNGIARFMSSTVPAIRSTWHGRVADFCVAQDNICSLPTSIGTEVKKAAVGGKFTAASVTAYRKVDWDGHYEYAEVVKQMIAAGQ